MMSNRIFLTIAVSGLALTAACSTVPGADRSPAAPPPAKIGDRDNLRVGPAPVASPDDVEFSMYDPDKKGAEITKIRKGALREAAEGYGSQMGYARRGWEIEKTLEKRSMQLSQGFDFSRVVSEAPVKAGYIVPPIVSRSFSAYQSSDGGRAASVADEYLTIVQPGKIVPVVPTWRDYLLFSPAAPDKPAESLNPRNKAEKAVFEEWFREGWTAGEELAEVELESRLSRLQRDYQGMLQYRRLVSKGMMDRMVLEKADFGVTGEDGEMRIGSRTVKVVSDAEFETNPQRWSSRTVSERDALIVGSGKIPPLSLSGVAED